MAWFERCAIISAALLFAPAAALAQAFPARPLRIMVAAAPSVPHDVLARGVAEPLSRALGQPVIVENRVGADGIIGTEACAKAPPDGYSLCGTASGDIIWNTVLRARTLPYDAVRDFAPVMHGGFFDSALVVHPDLGVGSVAQLVELARANPNKVNWAHFGVNSTGYMYEEWIRRSKGAPFYPVPYKTQPQVLTALLVNESSVAVYGLTNLAAHLKAGKLKALAVSGSRRVAFLPDVPTFEEEGIKLPLRTWFGYHYQAGVPRAIVGRVNAELRRVWDQPAFGAAVLDRLMMTPSAGSPEEFDAYIRAQIAAVKELVGYIGLKPE